MSSTLPAKTPATSETSPLPVVAPKRAFCSRALIVAVVIYVAGVATGSGGTFAWLQHHMFSLMRKPHGFEKILYASMKSELNLTKEQEATIQPIFSQRFREVDDLRREVHPRFVSLFAGLESEVAGHLTPEQKETWHARWKHLRETTFPPDPDLAPTPNLPGKTASGEPGPSS
ncbi:hypothetical protein Psta_1969 [Pirellula staleyi DSM 6068]|uniref:Periplasmic heavy metal sensor n=1 Tax=Pirellula staleyi (strain ATCC 27377 / DSM 6068 / ICPB 4128) TaxID=530564 RepID=D2R0P5_PIRSD|nr:hypothetical protein [Pirellula staleyi]ADB16643.1 hypothetical protein Psta_1969 [Pirellula staleyi DSM 6068]